MQPEENQPDATSSKNRPLKPIFGRVLIPIAVVLVGWIGFSIISVEPEKAKRPKGKARVLKTKVAELHVTNYQTMIRTQGIIRPHNEVTLTAQVGGKIVRTLSGFEDGAFFSEGDILMELDGADFNTTLIVAKANLARAATIYAQEQTRAKQARLNWDDLGYDEDPNELVLRLPQMREAEASVASAQAQVERAQRDLDRCKVRAPFDGRVRQRLVGTGQTIGGSTPLGTVFDTDFAEVRLPIAGKQMPFLTLPEDPADESVIVELKDVLNVGIDTRWSAEIIRTEGALDESSLELFAIARVNDPFGRYSGNRPLRIGQPVIGIIPGHVLTNVVVIPRVAVRQLDQIMLVDKEEHTLSSRTVSAIWSDADHLIVNDPTIPDGALLATTSLVYAPEGAKVEILPDLPNPTLEGASETLSEKTLKPKKPSGFKKPK
jgi:RND family efflux transporter MFP subunit